MQSLMNTVWCREGEKREGRGRKRDKSVIKVWERELKKRRNVQRVGIWEGSVRGKGRLWFRDFELAVVWAVEKGQGRRV
jgi:hypothetical protein